MVAACRADNTVATEQDTFWDGGWDAHRVGWLVAGVAAAITTCIALTTILSHARNYTKPAQQRHVIRVLIFPIVYAVVSFFSYRYFRAYTYYELAESAYEAFAIAAFLMLMLQYVGENVNEQRQVFVKKDKKPLPMLCCLRYRPSKAYFLVLLKWSVVQYCFIRPALSIAGIITEAYDVYCSQSYSYKYASVYITSIDFASITVALYGLVVLYTLVKEDLKGRRPLAKFLTIKVGIFLIFYQSFIFDLLANHGALKATEYWTTANIADGLNALCVTCEMVIIAAWQMWAFNWREYKLDRIGDHADGRVDANGKTSIWRSLLHALNFSDVFVELWREVVFLFDRIRKKPYTRHDARLDFVQAFGAEYDDDEYAEDNESGLPTTHRAQQNAPLPSQQPEMAQQYHQQHFAQSTLGQTPTHTSDPHSQHLSARSSNALLRPSPPR